jgi:uncharacterized protein (UPF0276 family)
VTVSRAQPDSRWPQLGFGVGLRSEHYEDVLAGRARADCREYLARLKALAGRIEPALVTDHLCWTGVDGRSLYDLLPLPYTDEALAHVAARVGEVQDFLGRPILLENASTYVEYRCSQMPEPEFLAELARRTGCGILLDLNNVHVSCTNHGWDPIAYVDAIPRGSVGQFHLAGFTDMGGWLFDTHSAPACEEVWRLYAHAVERFGRVSTLFEWDASIPPFEEVRAEAERARRIAEESHEGTSADGRDAAASNAAVARVGHPAT